MVVLNQWNKSLLNWSSYEEVRGKNIRKSIQARDSPMLAKLYSSDNVRVPGKNSWVNSIVQKKGG